MEFNKLKAASDEATAREDDAHCERASALGKNLPSSALRICSDVRQSLSWAEINLGDDCLSVSPTFSASPSVRPSAVVAVLSRSVDDDEDEDDGDALSCTSPPRMLARP